MKNIRKINPIAIMAIGSGTLVLSNMLFNKIDPRTRAFISGFSGLLLSTFNTENPVSLNIGAGLMIGASLDIGNSFLGGSIIENKFNGFVFCKNENNQKISILKPFETRGIIKKIDGLVTPYNKGMIYKIPNGCLVRILESGDIELASNYSKLINSRVKEKAGWKNKQWVDKFPTWIELYNKSL